MAQPEGLETRVTALETQVHELAERVRSSEQGRRSRPRAGWRSGTAT